jgi:phage baseplate assembly protein W
MPEQRTPAVFDPQTGYLGQPNDGDWLDIADRPWETLYFSGAVTHSRKFVTEQSAPITLNLGEPHGEIWISNQGLGTVTIASDAPLSGIITIEENETVLVAADGTMWRSLKPAGLNTPTLLPGQRPTLPDGSSRPTRPETGLEAWGVDAIGIYEPRTRTDGNAKPKRRGIAFPPQVDETTGSLKTSTDIDLIRDHIFSAILTYKTERPMRPRYGVDRHVFESRPTFEPIYEDLRNAIDAATGEHLSHLDVRGEFQPPGTLYIGIDWATNGIPGAPLRFELAF